MRFLVTNEVMDINKLTTQKYGGLHGIRDISLLESAITIIKNYPFLDGNKITGFLTMDLFLRLNGKVIKFPHKEAVETKFGEKIEKISETNQIMVKVATNEVNLEKLSERLKEL
jgi:prophage maintenance system killer protein